MARRKSETEAQFVDMSFPLGGIDQSRAFGKQMPRQTTDGSYARTTYYGRNVRAYEPLTNRARGGCRAGLSRYINAIPGGTAGLIQDLNVVVGAGYSAPGGSGQTSESGRVVTLVAVIGGIVYIADAGGTAWVPATNDAGYTQQLHPTNIIRSSVNNQKLYFADGYRWARYDPSDNKLETWGATSGELPQGDDGSMPRLIETWRGRTCLSGITGDPQNWFFSASGDPEDWDYSPSSITPTQAVAGNNSTLGYVGDVITGMVPYTDDLLIFLCDSSVWQMSGDPMAGGSIDRVSDTLGGAFGRAWAKGPGGEVFFFTNRGSVAMLVPGRQLTEISGPINQYLRSVNTGTHIVRMVWDSSLQGLHTFVTKISAAADTTHFYWEQRSGAWWVDEFSNTSHNPIACCIIDGNEPGDRAVLMGSWDGYVRQVDVNALRDDGSNIESEVWIGPLMTQDLDDMKLLDMQAVMGENSGSVLYSVHVAATAEAALVSDPVVTGTWTEGRNPTEYVNRAGHAVYVRLTATEPWQIEAIRARVVGTGKVRRRAIY